MNAYKLNKFFDDVVQRASDGAFLPMASAEYQAWLAEGNTPDPVDEPTVVERTTAVSTLRDQKLTFGFDDAVTGKRFQCDPDSIGKWTAVGSAAGLAVVTQTPASFQLITADNSIATLSASDAFALMQGRVMPWVSAVFIYARSLKDQIIAGGSPDVTQGWP